MQARGIGAWLGVMLLASACATGSGAPERAEPASASVEGTEEETTSSTSTSSTTTSTTTTTVPDPGAPQPATDPGEMAARISAAEAAVRDPATTAEREAAAFELQLLYRQLARTPEWDAAVMAAVPDQHRVAVQGNVAARREFRGMHHRLSDTLPAWRIVDPPPAEELLSHYREAEATFGVPWEILAAVNLVETGMGRIRGTSVAGALGPMQFMPATWEAFGAGGDVHDPHDAIMGAARYLAHNGGGNGDLDNALWNYNHDHRYVRGVKHYAAVMADDPRTFHGFYHWQIVYLSVFGDIWLPTGYEQTEPVTVIDYVAVNPHHHLGTDTG